jgi:pantoate--beta-alanine ligase
MFALSQNLRSRDRIIGFVPTMGALHDGHLSLMRRAREETGTVVASIFVNPTQFSPDEDFKRYPRDRERDTRLSLEAGVDILFAPEPSDIYPKDYHTYVEVEELTETLCGALRPGHFRGVTTVVLKLFNIVAPHRAYFGKKDFQQLVVIRKMTEDLNLSVEVVGCPTVREPDGLAMSSRNAYLTPEERASALSLVRSLDLAEGMIRRGERRARAVENAAREFIAQHAHVRSIDYVACVDPRTLKAVDTIEEGTVLAVAARVGNARLIDNRELTLSSNVKKSSEGE